MARPEERPKLGRSLFLGLFLSFIAPLVVHLGFAKEKIKLLQRETADPDNPFKLELPFTPIYIGIGGLLTLATALLVFGGSFLRLLGEFGLTYVEAGSDLAEKFPADTTMRWVGGGAMTVAVAYSLFRFRGAAPRGERGESGSDGALLKLGGGMRAFLLACIVFGVGVLGYWLYQKEGAGEYTYAMGGTVLVMAGLMVALGALLSLQIGSSASPVSGTVFVTTLALCLVSAYLGRKSEADVLLLVPLMVAGCVAVCTANDSSQDYKTMQLCGVRVQDGFLAQLLGLAGGCIVVPMVLNVAHEAYTLGSDQLTAPQGKMFSTLIQGLLLESKLPWYPICVGLAIGLLAVIMEIAAARRKIMLPSMALAVGIYLPGYLGVGILIGALFRWFAERGTGRQRGESILAAAGLITGAAALELILGVLILKFRDQGFSPEVLGDWAREVTLTYTRLDETQSLTLAVSENGQKWAAAGGIAVLGLLLFFNSLRGRRRDGEPPVAPVEDELEATVPELRREDGESGPRS